MSTESYSGFEKYNKIFDGECRMKPGVTRTVTFKGDGLEGARRLFVTGETDTFYMWKSESDYQMLYRRIDDALSSKDAELDRFALNLSGDFAPYPKVAYKKITAPLAMSYLNLETYNDDWKIGIFAKARGLAVKGYLHMLVEIRYKRDGECAAAVRGEADESFVINIPEGSYSLTELSIDAHFDSSKFASACFYVEGENYSGEIFLESPYFKNCEGRNILPPFIPHTADRPHFNWFGQNLSRAEWPSLTVALNGEAILDGEIFERCHRRSEFEIELPRGSVRSGENELSFTLTSDFRDAPGYSVCEVGLISERESRIISVPSIVSANEPFCVFVTGKRGETVEFSSDDVRCLGDLKLKRDGICAISLVTNKVKSDIKFTICGEPCQISRSVLRGDDGVLTGSGDLIYVDTKKLDVDTYLKWYLSSEIGNLLTIRPTYRWSGTRVLNRALWREVADILAEGNIKYSHMIDGRDLPGCDVNPQRGDLMSEAFLGRQNHEFDGQYTYWGYRDLSQDPLSESFYEAFQRMYKRYPETTNERYGLVDNLHYVDGKCTAFRRGDVPLDMKAAALHFINMLKTTRSHSTRHTGPATLFKYFYQAGYSWTGAELMYTPTELTASFLRGARDLYGGNVGAHLAVQWSTSPHDTEERYRRYLLALYISYMQGIDEINTEEGLWHLEEYYSAHHRFSPACTNHAKVQRDFYRFIKSHTRRGKFYTPIAFISGRYDGFGCFAKDSDVWGVSGMKPSDPERAWEVLRYFYPKSILDAIYRHDTKSESLGYYSGTPFGAVDAIPIEGADLSRYRLVIASGYNAAEECDLSNYDRFVRGGGTLLIGWPQLSKSTDRGDVVSYRHEYIKGDPSFTADTFMGMPLHTARLYGEFETLIKSDTGAPLVVVFKQGEGSAYFINAMEYAGNSAVLELYRRTLGVLAPATVSKENIYAEGDGAVQFTVYENTDGTREIYFISTDWYSESRDKVGKVHIGGYTYDIPVPFGAPTKLVASAEVGAYPLKNEDEVVSVKDGEILLQGRGVSSFVLLRGGVNEVITLDFTDEGCKSIRIR